MKKKWDEIVIDEVRKETKHLTLQVMPERGHRKVVLYDWAFHYEKASTLRVMGITLEEGIAHVKDTIELEPKALFIYKAGTRHESYLEGQILVYVKKEHIGEFIK